MDAIVAEWTRRRLLDNRWLAYMLATAFHETGGRMQPVRETFASSDTQAIKALEKAWKAGKLKWVKTSYWRDGWFGRGLVQITHEPNYKKFGISKDDALRLDVSVRVLFDGMIKGMFTGRKLADYFSQAVDEPVGARRIVNGNDKAKLIVGYHKNFLDAIQAAQDEERPADVKPADAKADDVPVSKSGTVATTIGTAGSGGLLVPLLTGLNNPYALAGFALMLIAAFVAFMFWSGRWSVNRSKARAIRRRADRLRCGVRLAPRR